MMQLQRSVLEQIDNLSFPIISHPGMWHGDDLLALAIIAELVNEFKPRNLRRSACVFQRLPPTPEQIADPTVMVVDCGGSDNPDLLNFDHHQHDAALPPMCGLTLVLKWLGIEDAARSCWPWLEAVEINDCRGPTGLQRHYGIDNKAARALARNPVTAAVTAHLTTAVKISNGSFEFKLLQMIGHQLLRQLQMYQNTKAVLDARPVEHSVFSCDGTVYANLTWMNPSHPVSQECLQQWLRRHQIQVYVAPSLYQRGDWAITRVDGIGDNIDLRRLATVIGGPWQNAVGRNAGGYFVHNTGFTAALPWQALESISGTDIRDVQRLIAAASTH